MSRETHDILQEGLPTTSQISKELKRVRYNSSFSGMLRSTIGILVTVAAIAVLIAVLLLPVLQIYGTSMTPTLDEGNIVISLKGTKFETGEVVAFYYNNKILVKRVIANPGEWVDIDMNGNVFVNNVKLEEPYIEKKSFGETNIKLPYQVPDSRIFVMGDNRDASIDSRNTSVGCVSDEQIVGKIVFRIWPLSEIGWVK
ncbi:MAG: signal peptidase I [Lachnospiraceae bacterium]|nr:signal peptidase I [Lachnospiraceae bacterium]